jgi:adenine/guanine phosphoribosyltransferase-like PRPP-binding protein
MNGTEPWLAALLRVSDVRTCIADDEFWNRSFEWPIEIESVEVNPTPEVIEAQLIDSELEADLWEFMAGPSGYGLYSLFSNPKMLSASLARTTNKLDEFDAIVACSLHGMPFAVWLQRVLHEDAVAVPVFYVNHTARKSRALPTADSLKDKRVLLVDSVVRTGGHANYAFNVVRRLGGIPVGVFCILDYDNALERSRVAHLLQEGISQFFCLCRASRTPVHV